MGKTIQNYVDPFVYATCDVVASTLNDVAVALKTISSLTPKKITIIDEAIKSHESARE